MGDDTNFNSRPSARGDTWFLQSPNSQFYFNSRPSARGDNDVVHFLRLHLISIHAPPRGATFSGCSSSRRSNISIHAPPRGATSGIRGWQAAGIFQFTPLREGRPRSHVMFWRPIGFQFTPLREGRQKWSSRRVASRHISIHAPPRGATNAVGGISYYVIFQFTPLREGRRETEIHTKDYEQISIHAPPRGATAKKKGIEYESINFNSRPSARGDSNTAVHTFGQINFNSRPSARGDHALSQTPLGALNFNSRPSARGD